jgi:hypothetical protein
LVFRARLMMCVNAATMESPVTTVYRIAPNAAAAIVPIAYSTIKLYNDCARWSHLPRPRMNSVSAGDGCKDCYWQTKGFLDR